MSEFRAFTLFSGSSGNCTYVKAGDVELLIDAGVCEKAIAASLASIGTTLDNISHIFVTHDHTDHTRGLEVVCKKHSPTVHITEGSARVTIDADKTPHLCERALIHPLNYTVELGDVTVSSFATPHDSAASVGYVVEYRGYKLGFATDVGHVTDTVRENLLGSNAVVLESNHDPEMLIEGPYPDFLKRRILSDKGHLSNDCAAELAAYLAENGTDRFVLAHLSEQNNIPELAFASTLSALGDIETRGIRLAIAEADSPTLLVNFTRREK